MSVLCEVGWVGHEYRVKYGGWVISVLREVGREGHECLVK